MNGNNQRQVLRTILLSVTMLLLVPLAANALLIDGGVMLKVQVADGQVGLYLQGTNSNYSSCEPRWYYANKTDFADADSWKAIISLIMTSYAQGTAINLFHASDQNCSVGTPKFQTVQTQ